MEVEFKASLSFSHSWLLTVSPAAENSFPLNFHSGLQARQFYKLLLKSDFFFFPGPLIFFSESLSDTNWQGMLREGKKIHKMCSIAATKIRFPAHLRLICLSSSLLLPDVVSFCHNGLKTLRSDDSTEPQKISLLIPTVGSGKPLLEEHSSFGTIIRSKWTIKTQVSP